MIQRDAGLGCQLGGMFLGAFGYADDVTLLAPSRQGLQAMLKICENFAETHSMQFSTDPLPSKSKSKCLFYSRKRSSDDVENVLLNGNKLPWVPTAKHLGNHLSSKLNLSFFCPESKTDLLCKRAILFDKVHQIIQQYGYLDPHLVVKLLSIYSTALYGSSLWQLNSDEHLQLNRSWNTAMKIIWDLPHSTHKRLLESLSEVPHLESVLHGRFIGFVDSLSQSKKSPIGLIFKSCIGNMSTQTGQNMRYLMDKYMKETLRDLVEERDSIKKLRVYKIEDEELWKIPILKDMALFKKGLIEIDVFDEQEAEAILGLVCTI